MFLHIFGHVDAGDGAFIVEQELGQSLGQLCLAHARRSQEQEGAERTVGVIEARAGSTHRIGHGHQGVILTDHAQG